MRLDSVERLLGGPRHFDFPVRTSPVEPDSEEVMACR